MQTSGGKQAAARLGRYIYLDATHNMCREGLNLANVLAHDGDGQGVIIAAVYVGDESAATLYCALRWLKGEIEASRDLEGQPFYPER